MIWLEELTNRKKISRIFNAYEKTFPEDERRSKAQFLELAENPDVFIYQLQTENGAIGYVVLWDLENYYFLEHFEVFEEFRNQKFGAEILGVLKQKFERIILESEPDSLDEIAKRRIGFYERNGFEIISKKYIQPSYGEGKNELPLYLMSCFEVEDLEKIIKKIHSIVYSA